MRILSVKKLKDFWKNPKHSDSENALKAWVDEVEKADWKNSNDVKKQYGSVSIIGDNRVVFNIKGNTYRLIVKINYDYSIVYLRFIGTHKQYDKINAKEI
ncbi:MAG: type II toxin-antitoxin system HigB family toxin [Cytophagales bacterium]|nr:type II toxin-antitoxin system HigB family toxin [Cytophagales bacterium]